MTKIRVHEYAKKVNRTSKEVIDELGKNNVSVSNHMATLDTESISKLDRKFGGQTKPADKQATNAASKPSNGQTNKPTRHSTALYKQRPHKVHNRPAQSGQGGNRPAQSGQNRPAQSGHRRQPSSARRKVATVRHKVVKAATVQHKVDRTDRHKVVKAVTVQQPRRQPSSTKWPRW